MSASFRCMEIFTGYMIQHFGFGKNTTAKRKRDT